MKRKLTRTSLTLITAIVLLLTTLASDALAVGFGSKKTDVENSDSTSSSIYFAPDKWGEDLIVAWDSTYSLVSQDGTVSPMTGLTLSPRTNDNSDSLLFSRQDGR